GFQLSFRFFPCLDGGVVSLPFFLKRLVGVVQHRSRLRFHLNRSIKRLLGFRYACACRVVRFLRRGQLFSSNGEISIGGFQRGLSIVERDLCGGLIRRGRIYRTLCRCAVFCRRINRRLCIVSSSGRRLKRLLRCLKIRIGCF